MRVCVFIGRHLWGLQEAPAEALWRQRLKGRRCLRHFRIPFLLNINFLPSISALSTQLLHAIIVLLLLCLSVATYISVCLRRDLFFSLIFLLNITYIIDISTYTYIEGNSSCWKIYMNAFKCYICHRFYFTCAIILVFSDAGDSKKYYKCKTAECQRYF